MYIGNVDLMPVDMHYCSQNIDDNIAKQVLIFLVVGINSDIYGAIGYFGTTSVKAGALQGKGTYIGTVLILDHPTSPTVFIIPTSSTNNWGPLQYGQMMDNYVQKPGNVIGRRGKKQVLFLSRLRWTNEHTALALGIYFRSSSTYATMKKNLHDAVREHSAAFCEYNDTIRPCALFLRSSGTNTCTFHQ